MTHATLRLALLVALCLASSAQAVETRYVTDHIVAELRAQPDPRSPIIAKLPTGTALELLDVSGDYAQVLTLDARRGWIATQFLAEDPPALATLMRLRDEQVRTRAELERVRLEKGRSSRWALVVTGLAGVLVGFVLGAIWIDHRFRVRHGGFRI